MNKKEVKPITEQELRWLLDGLSLEQLKAIKRVTERSFIYILNYRQSLYL